MTFAPCVVMFSSAVTWLALSVSVLPEAVRSLTLSFLACACAPSFIFTKNGFVSVLVMRPIVTSSSFLPALPPPPPPLSSSPHATTPMPSAATAASAATFAVRTSEAHSTLPCIEPSSSFATGVPQRQTTFSAISTLPA